MFRCFSAPSAEAGEGLWGREVGALLFQPLTHSLWGGNGAANSVLLCCTACRAERANHRNAQAPFKPDISPTGTNCPNNQHPNLLRASGAAVEWMVYRPVLRGRIELDCNANRNYKHTKINNNYRLDTSVLG